MLLVELAIFAATIGMLILAKGSEDKAALIPGAHSSAALVQVDDGLRF